MTLPRMHCTGVATDRKLQPTHPSVSRERQSFT